MGRKGRTIRQTKNFRANLGVRWNLFNFNNILIYFGLYYDAFGSDE
jgi:hypothetical protein